MAASIYRVDDRVVFTRERQRLTGTILAIGTLDAVRPDRCRVVIATDVVDLSGNVHHGNVIVLYKNIVSLAEEPRRAETEEEGHELPS